jgi:UDP-glucose 4-epimerase
MVRPSLPGSSAFHDPSPVGRSLPPAEPRRRRRVVVTGGAGFVGSHLCEELLRRGDEVLVVDDLSTGRRENLAALAGRGLRLSVASVADPAVAARACVEADFVFHLAGVVGVRRLARRAARRDAEQPRQHADDAGGGRGAQVPILITSSSEVYGDGPVPFREQDPVRAGAPEGRRGGYACAKAMGEFLALGHATASGLPVVVARLFNTVGPRQSGDHGMVLPRFVQQALRDEPLTVYGDGGQTRCFAHVGDVVRALADLAATEAAFGHVVNVGSDRETTVLALAELVRERAGSRSPIRFVPFGDVFPPGFGDPARRVPSLERLRALIGFTPSTPLAHIVDELVASGRARAAEPESQSTGTSSHSFA